MEGNITNKTKTMKSENKTDSLEMPLPEVDLKLNECKRDVNNCYRADKGAGNVKNNIKVLKRKVTEDGVMIERVLSEGEASSGFETVSSYDSKADFDDLDLSSLTEEDDFNVFVKVENELPFQNSIDPMKRISYKKGKSNSPVGYHNRTDHFLYEYKNQRIHNFRNYKDQKYGHNNSEKYYKYDRIDKKLSERDFNHSRQKPSVNYSRRSRGIRSNHENRSKHSRSCERINRSQSYRSLERNIRQKNYEDRKSDVRCSGSFDRNSAKSSVKRNSPSRKRKHSPFSKSSFVWKRLDNRVSPKKKKNKKTKKTKNENSCNRSCRKKERTPFLVELERKLKEAESLRNFKKETANSCSVQTKACGEVNVTVPIAEGPPANNQNSNSFQPTTYIPSAPNVQGIVYPCQYVSVPTLSMDNLPLVPGPTGLPVHITMTGEQIPYDMDGRRIPIGPNGYYLPVDPTGRLFPHIVSPANQAIPIHMKEDGILRLPNSDPVPYGPGHQLPVNIDGSVILIGNDSKPLYPCPNLPKEPPLNLLQMMDSFNAGLLTPQQTVPADIQQNLVIATQEALETNKIDFQQCRVDVSLLDFIKTSTEEINKTDFLEKYNQKAQERNKDILKSIQSKRNFRNNHSKVGMNKSVPIKVLQGETFTDGNCSSGCDMVLGSGDSGSHSALKSLLEPVKDLTEDIFLSSDDEQTVLKSSCDSEIRKAQDMEAKQDDPIIRKIKQAIKSLSEKNYKPPPLGRFIVTNLTINPIIEEQPNESPLLKNRVKLPFIFPNVKNIPLKSEATEKTTISFRFLPQRKSEEEKKPSGFKFNEINNTNFSSSKFPAVTFDFAVQCDFTTAIIKNLTSKVSELETKLVQLRNDNANLVHHYRNVQIMNEKKNDELIKAMQEIQERDTEIQSLKRSKEK